MIFVSFESFSQIFREANVILFVRKFQNVHEKHILDLSPTSPCGLRGAHFAAKIVLACHAKLFAKRRAKCGGPARICTLEGVSQQIYSLPRLTTSVPTQKTY